MTEMTEPQEIERLRSGARTLGTVVVALSRTLKAAFIELEQGHPEDAREWIAQALEDSWDGDDQWDGQETAQEWSDRTEASRA